MKYLLVIFTFFLSFLQSYSIVFVHIGPEIPPYVSTAVEQAYLFNPDSSIYLIGNREALRKSDSALRSLVTEEKLIWVECEDLALSRSHQIFRRLSTLDSHSFQGFWRFASERFFYLEELLEKEGLTDVFHLENDVMLYRDLGDFLPIFHAYYQDKLGATFDNDNRCIPGFIYISSSTALSKLTESMAKKARQGKNDMELISLFKKECKGFYIDSLPIIFPSYCAEYRLHNQLGDSAKNPEEFSRHFSSFSSIFDAAAIGQYLGGISPRNGEANPGFINESCFFDPSKLSYKWEEDERGRWLPFVVYKGEQYLINNLHIHSKTLDFFSSTNRNGYNRK